MNKITFIKKEKSKYTIKIVTDNTESTFKISEDLLIDSKFISLKEITDDELKAFMNKLPADSLLLDALKFTDKKMRTKKEIIDHLKEITSSNSLIDGVIEALEKKGLINDENYFKLITDYMVNEKMYGPLKVNQELYDLGLDKFNYYYDKNKLDENIKTLTIKFNLKDNSKNLQSKILKAKRFLLSKGYTIDSINSLFNSSLIKVTNESTNLIKDYEKLALKENDKKNIKFKLMQKGYSIKDIEGIINE